MKKIALILILIALIAGCAKKNQHSCAFRNRTSMTNSTNGVEKALAKKNNSQAVQHFKVTAAPSAYQLLNEH